MPEKFDRFNVFEKSDMKSEIRKELTEFFKPHNEKLSEFLGEDYNELILNAIF